MSARQGSKAATPRRGEIWRVDLDPTIGSETRKTRPCLVIGTDALAGLPVRIVVPLTTWQNKHSSRPWCVRIDPDPQNGLNAPSAADGVQVRCVSLRRFRKRGGIVDGAALSQALAAVALCLDLPGLP